MVKKPGSSPGEPKVMPRHVRIHSENADFQIIETLRRNREKRSKRGEFFLEGVRPIEMALAHNWRISAFVFAYDRPLSGWAKDILRNSTAECHYEMPAHLLEKLSLKEDTSELLAVVRMAEDRLDRIPVAEDLLVVVADRPHSPGNLGTLIRSCDALGAHGVIVTGHAVDVYDPATIRATTGSLFAMPVVRLPSSADLGPWIEETERRMGPVQVVATDESGDRTVWEHDFRRPTVLLTGNETFGLSRAYREMAHATVRIPMAGSASSLNVACAASIALYEIARQRQDWKGRG